MGIKKQESAIINSTIAAACIVTATIILLFASTSITIPTTVTAQTQNSSTLQQQQPQQQATEFRVQNTSMSMPAPNANCAKFNSTSCQLIPHQIVIALPLRQDGKIWTVL